MTRVVILAAGQGTRLRPLTDNTPKGLVPLFAKPLVEYQLEAMENCGLDNRAIVTGFLAEQFEPYGNTFFNAHYASTNMVASLFCASEFFSSGDDLIISYSDIIYSSEVLKKLLDADAQISVVADKCWLPFWLKRMDNPLNDAETFSLAADKESISELGSPPSSLEEIEAQYIGLIKIAGDFIPDFIAFYYELDKRMRERGKSIANMYMTDFIQAFIDNQNDVKAVFIERGWIEVDSVEDHALYESLGNIQIALQLGR